MTIIERIEQLNAERGWSLYELSKRADIAEATVYTWKRKNKSPSMSVLRRFAIVTESRCINFLTAFTIRSLQKSKIT